MYIEPNSTIKILQNVPLDKTYDHTIYFATKDLQRGFFNGKVKYTLTRQSYQRVQRGWMRVNIQAEDLYDCNYIMFQNTAFGNKWFYAFLKSVEYVNNNVAQIEFEIDVMQTWLVGFDYTLDECYVEREHSEHDIIFQNIVDENLELGEEYVCNAKDTFDMNTLAVCILLNKKVTQNGQPTTFTSKTINKIFVPCGIITASNVTATQLIDTIIDMYNEQDIIAVYEYPFIFGDTSTTTPTYHSKTVSANLTSIDGYTPKNKKLFSYPYNFLLVSNNSGQTAKYRWENWNTGTMTGTTGQFQIVGVFATSPEIICYPLQYRGITRAYDDGIMYSNFPQCPWSGDTFKAWWAQHKASAITSLAREVIGAGIKPYAGNVSGGLNDIGNVFSDLAQMNDIEHTPSQTYGQIQTESLNAGMGRIQFDFYSMSIKAQYARIIDDYFDRYGYATKRNKVPNISVRPHWCYTKTIGCTITGSIPSDDMATICSIYNNGITFWKSGNEVGNYTLDNRVDV